MSHARRATHRRRAHDSPLTIRLERGNRPKGLCKGRWILGNVFLAHVYAAEGLTLRIVVLGAAGLAVDVAGPFTTEVIGEDEALVFETLLDVAGTLEVGGWGAEIIRVGCAG